MSHLKINSHVGRSFILSHSPNRCYIINKRAISVGNEGELINWALEGKTFIPLFILIPTLNHEAANLVSFGIVNTITTIFESVSFTLSSTPTIKLSQCTRIIVLEFGTGMMESALQSLQWAFLIQV